MLWQVLGSLRVVCALILCTLLVHQASGQQTPAVDLYGDPLPPGATARLGTVRFRHGGDAFSPHVSFLGDSETLVTSPGSGGLRLWDARTGELRRDFPLHPFNVQAFTVSRDGKQIALAGFWVPEDMADTYVEIRVLNTGTGQVVQTLKRESTEDCHTLTFTPDGKLLASLGRSGTLRIEEISSGVELLTQAFPRDNSADLTISPNGKQIAVDSGANTRKFFLWAWESGEEPKPLKSIGEQNGGGTMQFSPDGRMLVWASHGADPIHVWETEQGKLLKRISPNAVDEYFLSSLQFSPDSKLLLASVERSGKRDQGRVDVWRTEDWQREKSIDFPAGRIAISRDGRLLASCQRAYDLERNEPLDKIAKAHRGTVTQIITRPGEVITASDDHSVRIWDQASGRQKLRLDHDHWVRAMAISPDGKYLASSSLDDTVHLWDLTSGKRIYRLPGHGHHGGTRAVAFTADGKHVCSFGDDFYLRVFEVRNGKALYEFRIRPEGVKIPEDDDDDVDELHMFGLLAAVQFSRNGKLLCLSLGKKIEFYDVSSGKVTKSLEHEGGAIRTFVFSADGQRMLAGAWGKPLEIKLPDGRIRSSLGREQTVTLWNLETSAAEKTIVIPEIGVGPLAFSPDGSRFAISSGASSQAMVFGLDGKAQGILPATPGRISRLAFAADGRSLITALADTSVLVWAPDALAEPPAREGE
jgi:WD40 repeat protein